MWATYGAVQKFKLRLQAGLSLQPAQMASRRHAGPMVPPSSSQAPGISARPHDCDEDIWAEHLENLDLRHRGKLSFWKDWDAVLVTPSNLKDLGAKEPGSHFGHLACERSYRSHDRRSNHSRDAGRHTCVKPACMQVCRSAI